MWVTCGIRNRGVWAYVTIVGIQIIPWQRSWNAENFSSDDLDASFADTNCKKRMAPWHWQEILTFLKFHSSDNLMAKCQFLSVLGLECSKLIKVM